MPFAYGALAASRHFADARPVPRWRRARVLRDALGMLAIITLAAWGAHALMLRQGLQRLADEASHRLEVEATRLEGELARFDYLPALLETAPPVRALLAQPRDAGLRAQASAYLRALNAIAGAEMLYVLAPDGLAAAASDDGQPGTPAGRDLSYRPYLQQALASGRGRFYGIGVTSGVPGYYLSYALPRGGPAQGVATVKIDLQPAERAWRQMPGQMLALDAHGVVVLASREAWKYRPRRPLDEAAHREATQARRYGSATLAPLAWRDGELLGGDNQGALAARRVRVEGEAFVATERAVDAGRWQLVLLNEEAPVQATARWAAASAALGATALLLAALVWRQRRRLVRQQLASRAALQAAHDSLEQRVQSRTAELHAAQAELVHAGQLAVLGQMSAGVVHEFNQPLAALHTLSDNAALLLARGRTEEASANLSRIAQLVARLGKLTGQLKAFAHKRSTPPAPVSVAAAVQEALALHMPRLRALGVEGAGQRHARQARRAGRRGAAGAGAGQSGGQCRRCAGRGRARGAPAAHRGPGACRRSALCAHRGGQRRRGHRTRCGGAPVRALLHHQSCGPGPGAGLDDLVAPGGGLRRQPAPGRRQ